MQAGKHVICEKPFAGYFGRDGDKAPIGKHVPKAVMYQRVLDAPLMAAIQFVVGLFKVLVLPLTLLLN